MDDLPLLVGHLSDESSYNYLHYIDQINNFSFKFFNQTFSRIKTSIVMILGGPGGRHKTERFLHTIASSGQNKTETLISSPLFLFLHFGSSLHFFSCVRNVLFLPEYRPRTCPDMSDYDSKNRLAAPKNGQYLKNKTLPIF